MVAAPASGSPGPASSESALAPGAVEARPAGGEPAAGECFEPAAAAAAGGEPEDDEECLEPAVAEGAGGEAEAEEDCDIEEAEEVRQRPAAAIDKGKGCYKCRWVPKGCGQCRQWAQEGLRGYEFQDDEVIAGGC